MATTKTIKVQHGTDFQIINSEDYDEQIHKPVVGEGEIIVKPLDVENAKPFIIDEIDFDALAYERVNATNENVTEVAKQVDRQTLGEQLEGDAGVSVADNEFTREYAKNNPGIGNAETIAKPDAKGKQTPPAQLKRAQENKK